MWLLSTARAEIHEFKSPEDIPPYAILSHIIDDQELESLEQLVALRKLCATGSESPRNLLSEMISDSCKLALDNKHEWIWIYPCCVDERNETKRDNDIADMFSFYEKSAVCYAYLDNVVEERPPGYYNRPFMGSPWFKDCRTVQALVAPKQVVFVSRLWKILGNKRQCAAELATELSIPMDLLLLRTNVQDYSVSQRMSWASERERVPAKPEDSIYSLLGLFGVRMRLRYEGVGQAFYCLQREIMKTSPDTSLFVWGEEASTIDVLSGKSVAVTPYDSCPVHSDHSAYLLAPALLHFQSLPGSYSTFISAKSNPSIWLPGVNSLRNKFSTPKISIASETPHMALAYLPMIDLTPDSQSALAFLHCYSSVAGHTALLLRRCKECKEARLPVYHCSGNATDGRFLCLKKEQLEEYKLGEPQWKEIYISICPSN